jgi:hypothetical protein
MTEPQPHNQTISPPPMRVTARIGIPTVRVRDYLASQHLWTARREAWLCRQREDEVLRRNQLDRRHRSHATTAVLSSVAFLEALINAVWQDAADEHSSYNTADIPAAALAAMRELWTGKENAERMMNLLGKFQLALVCAGHHRMPDNAEPYQSVDVLITLRNALVHFKPEWHGGDTDVKLVKTLKTKITREREFPRRVQPWFPNKVLGAGTASWACDSVVAFARDWYQRMGMSGDFDSYYIVADPFTDD